jgi:hypothetical protein
MTRLPCSDIGSCQITPSRITEIIETRSADK